MMYLRVNSPTNEFLGHTSMAFSSESPRITTSEETRAFLLNVWHMILYSFSISLLLLIAHKSTEQRISERSIRKNRIITL